MLQALSIKNFILIDEVSIEFEKGLCVITGETGAGKSILLDAILFSLGGKFSDNAIKNGCDYCSVTSSFVLNDDLKKLLEQFNIEYDEELLIKRVHKLGNRKKFLINDQVVTSNSLQQIAEYLFELHGQNSHYSLLSSSSHINILDEYGVLLGLKAELSNHFSVLQEITREITKITKERNDIEREIDYLTFVSKELTNLNIEEGEEEKLINIRRNLQSHDKKVQITQDILSHLETPEINNSINSAWRLIARNLGQNEEFASISSNIDNCYNSLEEARLKLHNIINNFDENEYNLEEIEDRLFNIRDKARKYNISCDAIPNFLASSSQQLNILNSKINSVKNLDARKLTEHNKYFELARLLSQKRIDTAQSLEQEVQKELEQLKMEKAVFKVEIVTKDHDAYHQDGIDNVRFIASTNPGMKLAPIDKIASGGELSRFMLALKTCLFDKMLRPTIIFDEIDTGIGGAVADRVGERLKKLSNIAQVIVITHQPQVAGKADQHIIVQKLQLHDTTEVTIKSLNNQERQAELARMISGKSITSASLKAAEELLN